jgi:hypothetical protein
MCEVELRPTELHWLEGSDPYQDCCVHGGVYLRLGDRLVSDGTDHEWTVSTAAFFLLRSVFRDYTADESEPLIPHCGHTMWPIEGEPDGLYLGGCDIGISWNIHHDADQTIHEFHDQRVVMPRSVWAKEVCNFSDEVHEFLMTAWPKEFYDEMDREGFELFMNLWNKYRVEADAI